MKRRFAASAMMVLPMVLAPCLGGAQTPPAATPAPTTAGPPIRQAWTSDRHDLQVGDIVTILIDEYTMAQADRRQLAVRDRSRDLGVRLDMPGGVAGGNLRTQNDVGDQQQGEASRRERFSAEISARVVELAPGGNLRIEGVKKLQIDDHEQEVTIRGWVRAGDVSTSNTVESWRVANAEILYDSNDELGKTGGFWSRIFDLIVP